MTEMLWQIMESSVWVDAIKYSYTYDGNNNLIEVFTQTWDGSTWLANVKFFYIYDINNNKTEWIWQSWDGSSWENIFKYLYTYTPATSIDEDFSSVNSYTLSNNYPNPFNPSTIIKFSLPSSGYTTLKTYNSLGEEVAVLLDKELTIGSYNVEWNAGGLPSGVYFYQLQTEGFVGTKKMILKK